MPWDHKGAWETSETGLHFIPFLKNAFKSILRRDLPLGIDNTPKIRFKPQGAGEAGYRTPSMGVMGLINRQKRGMKGPGGSGPQAGVWGWSPRAAAGLFRLSFLLEIISFEKVSLTICIQQATMRM